MADTSPRRVWPRVLLAVALLVVLAAAWLGWRAWQVWDALAPVEPALSGLQERVADADLDALAEVTTDLPDAAARASAATGDPVWRAAEHLPWLGTQLRAVSAVTAALDLVATDVLPPLSEAAEALDPAALAPVDGRVDVDALSASAPAVHGAAEAAVAAQALLAAVDPEPLVAALAGRVVRADDAMTTLAAALGSADQVLALAPGMLGADGPRHYLLLVVNPAEPRALGGIAGSLAVLTVDDGRIGMGDYVAARALGPFAEPVVDLTAAEQALYGDRPARFVQDVTMSPDLPRAATIATAMWRERTGQEVDGVVTVDPVALAALLRALPGLEVDGVTLTSENAARELLFEAYLRYPDPDASDEFFGEAAVAVFEALFGGDADPAVLLEGLRESVEERRIGLWSAHPDEQAVLTQATVGGAFAAEQTTMAGVFLDDGTMTKIGYFLDVAVATEMDCQAGTVDLTVDLTADTPPDVASLPPYVVGSGDRTGLTQVNVTVYSPVGGRLLALESDGVALASVRAEPDGREAASSTVVLQPGEHTRVVARLALPAGQSGIEVRTSPTVRSPGIGPAVSCPKG